ncbi:helix-turn-helix domain-containing protein [Rubellimicrobium mesophilum]|uniref:helix-turn-helix domain-containing protein n=1 Tax=Rubellimicrobium mesophilum TaxID=1123067 RepID=UPI0009E8FA07
MKRSSTSHLSRVSTALLEALAAEVRAARKERGWTENDLAERLGSSRDTVRAIEAARPSVAAGTLFEAAYVLGLPLLGGDANVARIKSEAQARLVLLPGRVRPRRLEVNDDF